MEQVIYTYGGGEVLWKVFNALAMIFKSNNGYMTTMVRLTLGIGALWAAYTAMVKGSIMALVHNWTLPIFLLLSLFLIPKTSVHIIDRMDSDHHYLKIDNVPVGVAFVASFSSQLGDAVARQIDSKLGNTEAARYGVTGPVFGARLVKSAHDLQIRDPIMRQNIKAFVGQCFMWPYVFTNIAPGRNAALAATDILQFIAANPHPSLGVFWRDATPGVDRAKFMRCSECIKVVRQAMNAEVIKGRSFLASELFGSDTPTGTTQGRNAVSSKLMTYFPDAWFYMARESTKLSQAIEQEMMINSYREVQDDQREARGLSRIDARLISHSAERAKSQQNTSFIIKGVLAERFVPIIQSVITAFVIMFFVLVAIAMFLPGGSKILITWVKLNVWVHSWPAFYAIINGIGHLWMIKAGQGVSTSCGSGLSLLTQSGLHEAASNATAFVMGLQLTVPFVSWAFIGGSGYAITQLATSITQGLEGNAMKVGGEIAEGNVSVGNKNMFNETISGMQIAQQNLGPSHNFARTVNDGTMQITYGDQGSVVGNALNSNLGTNISSNDNFNNTISDMYQKSNQLAGQSLVAFTDRLSQGQGFNTSVQENENTEAREAASTVNKVLNDYAKNHNVSMETAASTALSMGAGKFFKMNADLSAKAGNSEAYVHSNTAGDGKEFQEAFSKVLSHSKQDNAQFKDDVSKDLASSLNRNHTESENWQQLQQYSAQSGVQINRNENDQILQYIADNKFGGNKEQALRLAQSNPRAYEAEAQGYIQARVETLKEQVGKATQPLSPEQISRFMDPKHLPSLNTSREMIQQKIENLERRQDNSTHQASDGLNRERLAIQPNIQLRQNEFKEHDGNANLHNLGKKAVGDTVDSVSSYYDRGVSYVKGLLPQNSQSQDVTNASKSTYAIQDATPANVSSPQQQIMSATQETIPSSTQLKNTQSDVAALSNEPRATHQVQRDIPLNTNPKQQQVTPSQTVAQLQNAASPTVISDPFQGSNNSLDIQNIKQDLEEIKDSQNFGSQNDESRQQTKFLQEISNKPGDKR